MNKINIFVLSIYFSSIFNLSTHVFAAAAGKLRIFTEEEIAQFQLDAAHDIADRYVIGHTHNPHDAISGRINNRITYAMQQAYNALAQSMKYDKEADSGRKTPLKDNDKIAREQKLSRLNKKAVNEFMKIQEKRIAEQ